MDISNYYKDYVTSAASQATGSALSDSIKRSDYANATDEQMMDACKQFESYFLEQVMKKMMDTVSTEEDSVMNNQLVSYFMDSTMTELCKEATEQKTLGLAQVLYEQMKRNYGVPASELEQPKEEPST